MNSSGAWEAGSSITVKEVWRGRVWSARPMTVVDVSADELVLWLPAGTAWTSPDSPPGRPAPPDRGERIAECLVRGDWVLLPRVWKMHTLWFLPAEAPYAVWICWEPDWRHLGWYVNFQTRAERRVADRTVHYMDSMLDMRIAPDSTWSLRDADHLAGFVARGLISAQTAAALHKQVEIIAGRVAAGGRPFGESWTRWRPDPAWRRPELPPDWEQAQ